MDIIFHAATGLVIAKATTNQYLPLAALYSVLPDVLGFTPHVSRVLSRVYRTKTSNRLSHLFHEAKRTTFYSDFDRICYRTTHSLLFWLGTTVLTMYLFPHIWKSLSLIYLSHILIDLPTHDGQFSQYPFFPLSTWHVRGAFWVTHTKHFFLFWIPLFIGALLQFLFFH